MARPAHTSSASASSWKQLSLGLAFAIGAGLACVPAEDTSPDNAGSCPILVLCASTFSSSSALGVELEQTYGPDGGCWELGQAFHEDCRESCVNALAFYNEQIADTGRSCGLCSTDGDCSEFGSDATCEAGYCARVQIGDLGDAIVGDETGTETGDEETGETGEEPDEQPLSDECDVEQPRVRISTNLGDMVVDIDRASEPDAAEAFLRHVSVGYYDNIIFHRVIDGAALYAGVFYLNFGLANPVEYPYGGDQSLAPDGDHIALTLNENAVSGAFYLGDGAASGNGVVIGSIVEGLDVRDAISAVDVINVNWQGFLLQDTPAEAVVISTATCL